MLVLREFEFSVGGEGWVFAMSVTVQARTATEATRKLWQLLCKEDGRARSWTHILDSTLPRVSAFVHIHPRGITVNNIIAARCLLTGRVLTREEMMAEDAAVGYGKEPYMRTNAEDNMDEVPLPSKPRAPRGSSKKATAKKQRVVRKKASVEVAPEA